MPRFSILLMSFDIWQGFEYASNIEYAIVLDMLWYSYNNIIIETVIILEFLSVQFVHSAAPQLTILPFFNKS